MSGSLAAGGGMAFEAARGGAESLGGAEIALFVCGAAALALLAALLVAAGTALGRADASLDDVEGALDREEAP